MGVLKLRFSTWYMITGVVTNFIWYQTHLIDSKHCFLFGFLVFVFLLLDYSFVWKLSFEPCAGGLSPQLTLPCSCWYHRPRLVSLWLCPSSHSLSLIVVFACQGFRWPFLFIRPVFCWYSISRSRKSLLPCTCRPMFWSFGNRTECVTQCDTCAHSRKTIIRTWCFVWNFVVATFAPSLN